MRPEAPAIADLRVLRAGIYRSRLKFAVSGIRQLIPGMDPRQHRAAQMIHEELLSVTGIAETTSDTERCWLERCFKPSLRS
jgi:hypothetical protein